MHPLLIALDKENVQFHSFRRHKNAKAFVVKVLENPEELHSVHWGSLEEELPFYSNFALNCSRAANYGWGYNEETKTLRKFFRDSLGEFSITLEDYL